MEKQVFIETYSRERWGTDSLKWDGAKERYGKAGLLPVWVADMDFAVPESVQEALIKRVQAGIFGYSLVPADYVASYQGWQNRHFGTQFQAEWLVFSTGVVQALYDLIECFTNLGDSVLVQSPVYYPFYEGINNKKRNLVVSPLQKTAGGYQMDLANFKAQIIEKKVKLFILCSPHNPVGRVWTEEELAAVLAICQQQDVLVVSDEIHSDFIAPGKQFVSALSVAENLENLIVYNAPSKTFNMATLLNAHIWIPSEKRRATFAQWSQQQRATEYSSLGQLAAMVAYRTGDEWFAALKQVIWDNANYLEERFKEELPLAEVAELQGTYLLWVNLGNYQIADLPHFMESTGLAVDYGSWFAPESEQYIRINLATTPERIIQVADRLVEAIQKLPKAGI